jgi:hypothetical protein
MVEKGKLGEKLYQVFVCAQAKAMEKPIKPKQWSKLEPNERLSWSEVAAAAWANTCNPEACEHIATNAQAFQAKVAEQEKRHAAEIKEAMKATPDVATSFVRILDRPEDPNLSELFANINEMAAHAMLSRDFTAGLAILEFKAELMDLK